MAKIPFYLVRAFTSNPLEGNPAGVVLNAEMLNDEEMQRIASEIGASETAFVMEGGKADYRVRFFSPEKEVSLCGHATIATFYAMSEMGLVRKEKLTVETRAGIINVEMTGKMVFMEQMPPIFKEANVERREVAAALGIREEDMAELPMECVSTGLFSLKVPVKNLEAMGKMKPDFDMVKELCIKTGVGSIFPFTFETVHEECMVHARCFAPLYGVNEDPVTGTANGALGAYLKKHGLLEKNPYRAEQGIEIGRKGIVIVEVNDRIKVGGEACLVMRGEIEIS